MKQFKFRSETIIEAETEEKAKDKFADISYNFAADASCEEVEEDKTMEKWVFIDFIEDINGELNLYVNPTTRQIKEEKRFGNSDESTVKTFIPEDYDNLPYPEKVCKEIAKIMED